MKRFLDKDFILETPTAKKLFHNFAEKMPIFDFHNHLSAKEIYENIKSGKENFAQAAMEYSSCPSKRKGGDLGYFSKGKMVRPFEEAAFSLEIGKVSQPVQTDFGWHLILVTDVKKVAEIRASHILVNSEAQAKENSFFHKSPSLF